MSGNKAQCSLKFLPTIKLNRHNWPEKLSRAHRGTMSDICPGLPSKCPQTKINFILPIKTVFHHTLKITSKVLKLRLFT